MQVILGNLGRLRGFLSFWNKNYLGEIEDALGPRLFLSFQPLPLLVLLMVYLFNISRGRGVSNKVILFPFIFISL